MKYFFLLFIFASTQSIGQDFSQQSLWKGYTVHDRDGNEIRYKRQDFIKFQENKLFLFQFQELMSMKTGEVKIEIVIDTFNIPNTKLKGRYRLRNKVDSLRLVQKSSTEFNIYYPKFYLTFKALDISKSEISLAACQKSTINSTFSLYNINKKENDDEIKRTYQENGKAKYSTSTSNWESAYKIVEFEGYVFIKGITSAPLLVQKTTKNKLICIALDYRFEPEEMELRREK